MTEASFTQHGMWIMEQAGAGSAYHMPIVIRLPGPPDHGALAKAVAGVVERHPLLGCAVRDHAGEPRLVPAAERPALVAGPGDDGPFDLDNGPLIRFALDGDTLRIVAHHLVFDGQSKDVLVADLAALHDGALPPPLEPVDHVALQKERVAARLEEARTFWTGRWREPGDVAVAGHVLSSRRASPGELTEFALDLPEMAGLTRFEVLLAAVHAQLRAYGNDDVVTAVDLSTRTPAEAGHVGPYVNELPVFSAPAPDMTFAQFAAGLRAELRQVYRVREVPVARAVPGVRPHAALAPVSVSYRRGGVAVPGWEVEWLAFNGAVRGALQLQVLDGPGGATAGLRYDPRELPDPGRFTADLRGLLTTLARTGPERPLRDLTLSLTRTTHVVPGLARDLASGVAPDLGSVAARDLALDVASRTGGPAAPTDVPASTDVPSPADVPASADLPTPTDVPVSTDVPAPADDPLLAEITAIWEEVLKLSPVEPHDDIFDLGGHSLTITQIIARMRKRLGVEIDLDDFFDNPTIAGVVEVIRR
jgi:acyl carrier protein